LAKTKIEVLNAVIDGHKQGEQLDVDAKSAKHLIAIGYAKEVEEKPAPKKPAAKKKDK
jgi:hypothetical protein